jgi:hypothetical protein
MREEASELQLRPLWEARAIFCPMSVCPSSEEEPSPTSKLLNELRILQEASEASRKNFEAISKRIKELEKYLAKGSNEHLKTDAEKA